MLHGLMVLALVMAGIGVALCAAMILIMARMLIKPKKMTDARALVHLHRLYPSDLGMEYENVTFQVLDGCDGEMLKIAGWWIPTSDSRGRCAVLLHGYSDAKVGAIAWAPLLRSFGFNILAVDLRAHGESGGAFTSAGFWERHDISRVIDQIKASRPGDTRQILLFGISLGAAVAAATGELRDDLWAVILESPFANFHNAAVYQADRMGTPGPFFQENAYRLAKRFARADFGVVRPSDTIRRVRCPLMVIQSGDDPFLSESDLAAVRQAVAARDAKLGYSVCWRLPGIHHVVGLSHDPVEYRRQIEDFFSRVLQNTVVVCDK